MGHALQGPSQSATEAPRVQIWTGPWGEHDSLRHLTTHDRLLGVGRDRHCEGGRSRDRLWRDGFSRDRFWGAGHSRDRPAGVGRSRVTIKAMLTPHV